MAAAPSSRRRLAALVALVPLLAAACGGADDDAAPTVATTPATTRADAPATEVPERSEANGGPITVPLVDPSPPDVIVSGLSIARGGSGDGAPEPLVNVIEIISGGPPPDGIPSIDEPVFLRAVDVDFLAENEPVLALEIDGDVRAYPVQILMWHEIVNDTVDGVPVAVTYCPLCNSALAYDRRIDGRVMEFGTSGLLWNSALVMYDRQTETLWSHFTGQGIVGELTGLELAAFPVATVPWGVWRDANPGGLVLSRDTGFDREYGRNPYPGYDDVNSQPFLFEGEVDGRYTAMTRIAGVELDGEAVGVPLVALQDERVVAAELRSTDLVFFWQPGTASALDAGNVAGGDDIGATGAFIPEVDGQALTFTATHGGFVDDQTGTTWNLLGQAVDGALAGTQLAAVPHVDTFWFAWSAFRPDTVVVER
ncbi:MAG: DUF3179 domain-containing protein [Acidimicrobiia bacterium]